MIAITNGTELLNKSKIMLTKILLIFQYIFYTSYIRAYPLILYFLGTDCTRKLHLVCNFTEIRLKDSRERKDLNGFKQK